MWKPPPSTGIPSTPGSAVLRSPCSRNACSTTPMHASSWSSIATSRRVSTSTSPGWEDRAGVPGKTVSNDDPITGSSRSCSVRIARHQHPEDWMTAHVRERQIDVVRGGIDRDRVSLRRPVPAELSQGTVSLLEYRHDPRLGGHVQPAERWVERQDVGIAPDWQHLTQLKGPEIQHTQRAALLAGDERQPVRCVDVETVRVPDCWVERDAAHDGGGRGID